MSRRNFLGAATLVGELKGGEVREYEIHPEDYGLQMQSLRQLRVGSAEGVPGSAARRSCQPARRGREIVCLNAGAALYVAAWRMASGDGIAKAREAIASGAARAKLDQFVQCATPGSIIIHIQNSGGDMALPQQKQVFDATAYLAWEAAQPERNEFMAGEVFAMDWRASGAQRRDTESGQSVAH